MTSSALQLEKARAAKQKAKSVFSHLEQISGIGLTRQSGRYAVKVLLSAAVEDASEYPNSIDGVPIVFQVIGKVKKQPKRVVSRKKAIRKRRAASKSAKN